MNVSNHKSNYIKNPYFSLFKEPSLQIYAKKDIIKKDWLLPYRKASFAVSSHFRVPKMVTRPRWMFQISLNLSDLLPSKSPYVPFLIQKMINIIEKQLSSGSITIDDYISKIAFKHPSTDILHRFLKVDNKISVFNEIKTLPISWVINMLKLTLFLLNRKPLFMTRKHIQIILKEPLSDKYRIPNKKIKDVIKESCLALSRSNCDTLAFIMIHIIHFWKYDYAPTPAKCQLADVFGPLLIEFELKDLVTDDSTKSPEAALLEIILEMCDYQFWYQLSLNEVSGLFRNLMSPETRHFQESSASTFKTSRPINLSPAIYFK